MNERAALLIAYLSALASVQAAGVKVRDEILRTITMIEGEIEGYEGKQSEN